MLKDKHYFLIKHYIESVFFFKAFPVEATMNLNKNQQVRACRVVGDTRI